MTQTDADGIGAPRANTDEVGSVRVPTQTGPRRNQGLGDLSTRTGHGQNEECRLNTDETADTDGTRTDSAASAFQRRPDAAGIKDLATRRPGRDTDRIRSCRHNADDADATGSANTDGTQTGSAASVFQRRPDTRGIKDLPARPHGPDTDRITSGIIIAPDR